MSDKIQKAAQHYVDLKTRRRHPVGKFDRGGRWYPAQEHACCAGIRGPSRTYPFSLLTHCRSAAHVAAEHGVENTESTVTDNHTQAHDLDFTFYRFDHSVYPKKTVRPSKKQSDPSLHRLVDVD